MGIAQQRMMKSRIGLAMAGAVAAASSPAFGLIIADNGTQPDNPAANQVRPASDPGWDNVGFRGFGTASTDGATAIYLGSRYVLTAAHVGAGPVTFFTDDPSGGSTFTQDGSFSPVQLKNPGGSSADLIVYRLSNDPGIAPLNIASSSPTLNAATRIIGTGLRRGSATQNNTTIPPNGGYFWGTTRDKVFGDDTVSDLPALQQDGSGGQSEIFRTTFDPQVGQVMAADKDSGSAAFIFNTALNRWELAGVTSVIFTFTGQPGNTAAFGDQIGFIDVSQYRSQLPIPEPSAVAGIACGGLLLPRRKRRSVR